ncbi:MAG: glycosyltransferase family 4 protein [Anaerolineales bacterium]
MRVALIEFRQSTPYPVQLANELGKLCQVMLLLPKSAHNLVSRVDQEQVDLRAFAMPRLRQLANLRMVRDIRNLIDAWRPDLTHITHWHVWGSPGVGFRLDIPLVATVHDLKRHPGDHGWRSIPSFLYPLQWRWADDVIVHAQATKNELISRRCCSHDRVHVLPIGSYDYFQSWSQSRKSPRPHSVLFFGRIWDYKGLMYLIKAEPLITQAIPGTRIVIAGVGEPFDKYRQAMVNPRNFEVHNHRIPPAMVAELFQSASVVVLPYTESSQSGVIPVAYAFGKPVVATTVGGIPECVDHGETGYLVPPCDIESLADAVVRLLSNDSARHQMGCNARAKAETSMSWSAIARQTLSIYQAALERTS